jgi:hypothetical protein
MARNANSDAAPAYIFALAGTLRGSKRWTSATDRMPSNACRVGSA